MFTLSLRGLGKTIVERASKHLPLQRRRSLSRARRSRDLRIEELENRQLLSTFAVNSIDDSDDGTCDVSHCSLREAISAANNLPGADAIHFDIPVSGVPTIRPASELPQITEAVTIDGTTQPAGLVELDGSLVPADGNSRCGSLPCGLLITGGGSTVRGLVVNRYLGNAIHLTQDGGNVIQGNFIGTDPSGSTIVRNGFMGVGIQDSSNNTIGGTTPSARNVISGNGHSGIYVFGLSHPAENNVIQGNFIGTDVNGNVDLGNDGTGILVTANNNLIGGLDPGAGNLISGNKYAIGLSSNRSVGNRVVGNFIGTDATGTRALEANDFYNSVGVSIDGGLENTIGGTTPEARNVISGFVYGVVIEGKLGLGGLTADQTGARNVVQGNFIGTDVTGTGRIGNREHGVMFYTASNNTIGGLAAGAGNTIAFSGSDGVRILERYGPSSGDAILGNAIHSNAGLGINLGEDGFTSNDPLDIDTGANQRQNFPHLISAGSVVRGTMNSTPDTSFRIEFFSVPSRHAAGVGEGARFLGFTNTMTGSTGNAEFTVRFSTPPAVGHFVTATATDQNNNTSEYTGAYAQNQFEVNSTGDQSDADPNDGACDIDLGLAGRQCTLRAAIESANSTPGVQSIDFAIPDPVPAIKPASALPIITAPLVIDGLTQPGFTGTPLIELDGSSAGASSDGLNVTGGLSTVRGLAINRFGGSGIVLRNNGNNVIEQNVFGLDRSGTIDRGNGGHGVLIDSTSGNTIGGSSEVQGNVIGFNGRNGVTVVATQSSAISNTILSNSVLANRGLGIDLGDDGVQANDGLDADGGPNGSQNRPVLLEAADGGVHTQVRGSISSTPVTEFLLQFFATARSDSSSGQRLLGSANVTTDAQGSATFSVWLPAATGAGEYVIATATDHAGNTSEFAAPVVAIPNRPPHAVVGGPYRVREGKAITLDARASNDPDQPTDDLLFEWDLDDDGVYGEVGSAAERGDEIGARPVYSAAGLGAPMTLLVSVKVTDDDGESDFNSTDILIAKNEPPVADHGGPYSVMERDAVTLDASGTRDLDQPPDALLYEWDLDGDGIFGESGPDAQRGTEIGIYPVFFTVGLTAPLHLPLTLRVTDDEGLVDEATTVIHVTVTVHLAGTSRPDVILISRSVSGTDLLVNLNGSVSQYAVSEVGGFTIDAGAGNDRVEIAATVLQNAAVSGGLGNDTITGGGGNDMIDGGDGHDRLGGSGGNDRVAGGAGNDTLLASRGSDVLSLGSGRNSIVLGDLTSSLKRLQGIATSTVTQKSANSYSRTDISLDSTLSGSISYFASASGTAKRCSTTVEVEGDGTVSNLSHSAILSGRASIGCNGRGGIRWGSVQETVTGRINLQSASITRTGTIEMSFEGNVTRKRVRGNDYLIEVTTEIT